MGTVCTVPALVSGQTDVEMPIVLYQFDFSPPCRAVIMTARHLGLDLTLKEVNLLAKEQLKPEYLKINPQHSIPTMDDDGFILWESRAIMTYLVNKYAPNNPLYPEDPRKKAEIDRMLYFDVGNYYKKQAEFLLPQLLRGVPPDEEKNKALRESLAVLDAILEKNQYVAGDQLSLADLSILVGITFAEAMDYDFSEFSYISNWVAKLKKDLPYYSEVNDKPIQEFRKFLNDKKQNK